MFELYLVSYIIAFSYGFIAFLFIKVYDFTIENPLLALCSVLVFFALLFLTPKGRNWSNEKVNLLGMTYPSALRHLLVYSYISLTLFAVMIKFYDLIFIGFPFVALMALLIPQMKNEQGEWLNEYGDVINRQFFFTRLLSVFLLIIMGYAIYFLIWGFH
ncbi:hypothetical protein A1D23_10810 [Chelonobacter oris]|uniref:hypothetical protein n=1 Tax=Chelonobacter oris TaxID=505317 RepID=UPI002447DF9A|nr:hypothetical protein [Chelonobacter oris]MDH3000945.1 hypothetical protein [Chelonobacter oris]